MRAEGVGGELGLNSGRKGKWRDGWVIPVRRWLNSQWRQADSVGRMGRGRSGDGGGGYRTIQGGLESAGRDEEDGWQGEERRNWGRGISGNMAGKGNHGGKAGG